VAKAASDAKLDPNIVAKGPEAVPGVNAEALERAAQILREAAQDPKQKVAVVFAPNATGAALVAETAKGAANIALLLRGKQAARSFYLLPAEANVHGARDMGVSPDLGPGRAALDGEAGLDFAGMVEGALEGRIKALVVAGDNPLMFAPARGRVQEALGKLEFLLVIDQVLSETAKLAHTVLAGAPTYGKDGTITSADRRVLRLRAAQATPGDARPAWHSLTELARRLARATGSNARFPYEEAADVTDEIARKVPGYKRFRAFGFMGWGRERAVSDKLSDSIALQPVAVSPVEALTNGEVALLTGRTLYTSLEGAALRSQEADRLHREDGVLVNQYDATELGIAMGDAVVLKNHSAELTLVATLTTAVPRGSVFVSSYYDGGAVTALLPAENGVVAVPRVTLAKA
jgi:predicted molibdopterin-dependent oxidoreductase YjgC